MKLLLSPSHSLGNTQWNIPYRCSSSQSYPRTRRLRGQTIYSPVCEVVSALAILFPRSPRKDEGAATVEVVSAMTD